MERRTFLKNISGTACVLGLALSTMSTNSTSVISGYEYMPNVLNGYYDDNSSIQNDIEISNIYFGQRTYSRVENEAKALFGTMRDATLEERASVNKYIKSISKKTGVNFFDLC